MAEVTAITAQIPVECLVKIFEDASLPVAGTEISMTPIEEGVVVKLHRDEGDYIYSLTYDEEGALALEYTGFASNTPYQA